MLQLTDEILDYWLTCFFLNSTQQIACVQFSIKRQKMSDHENFTSLSWSHSIHYQNFQSGVCYSSLTSARSALKALLNTKNGPHSGNNQLRPALPNQMSIWNADNAKDYLRQLDNELSMHCLSEKYVIQVCLAFSRQGKTVKTLNIKCNSWKLHMHFFY